MGPNSPNGLGISGLTNIQEIARGGNGRIFRAEQPEFNRVVAVKVLADLSERAAARFKKERRALGALGAHPHIVTIFDTGYTQDDRPYLLMEYLEAGSIADYLRSKGPIDWATSTDMTIRICGALQTAHNTGILHRDIKPANILFSSYGDPILADFGLATIDTQQRTSTGHVTATVIHSAPEILAGQPPSRQSDVYSLGSTLFTLITGISPFESATDESILPVINRIATEAVPDLRLQGVPDDLCTLIEWSMAKRLEDRPHTAEEFGGELQSVLARHNRNSPPMRISGEIVSVNAGNLQADNTGMDAAVLPENNGAINSKPVAASNTPPTPLPPLPAREKNKSIPLPHAGLYEESEEYPALTSSFHVMQKPSRRLAKTLLLSLGAVVLLLLAVGFLLQMGENDEGKEKINALPQAEQATATMVPIPNLEGMLREKAVEELDKLGLGASVTSQAEEHIPEDTVISQVPAAQTDISVGSIIVLTVSTGPGMKIVPNIVGLPKSYATKALTDVGLNSKFRMQTSNSIPQGKVMRTLPPAESKVESGSIIEIVISAGTGKKAVPDVRNLNLAAAQQKLEEAGFSSASESQTSESIEKGLVIRTNPKENLQIKVGSTITIVVSAGKAPRTVPNVNGLHITDAENIIVQEGLNAKIQRKISETVTKDHVIETAPLPGRKLSPGSTVTLVVSEGSGLRPVPNVVGFSLENASGRIQRAGLTFDVRREESATVPPGNVIRTIPASGTQVAEKTRIMIVVAQAPPTPAPEFPILLKNWNSSTEPESGNIVRGNVTLLQSRQVRVRLWYVRECATNYNFRAEQVGNTFTILSTPVAEPPANGSECAPDASLMRERTRINLGRLAPGSYLIVSQGREISFTVPKIDTSGGQQDEGGQQGTGTENQPPPPTLPPSLPPIISPSAPSAP